MTHITCQAEHDGNAVEGDMTTSMRARAREADVELETRGLRMLDDDQCMASFIRWRTWCGDHAAGSLRQRGGIEACVSVIFGKAPE